MDSCHSADFVPTSRACGISNSNNNRSRSRSANPFTTSCFLSRDVSRLVRNVIQSNSINRVYGDRRSTGWKTETQSIYVAS